MSNATAPTDEELRDIRERALYSDGWKYRSGIASEAIASRALYDHGARRERAHIVARLRAKAQVYATCGRELESTLCDELADELETEQ